MYTFIRDDKCGSGWFRASGFAVFQILEMYLLGMISHAQIRIPNANPDEHFVDVKLYKNAFEFEYGDVIPAMRFVKDTIVRAYADGELGENLSLLKDKYDWKDIATNIAKRNCRALLKCIWMPPEDDETIYDGECYEQSGYIPAQFVDYNSQDDGDNPMPSGVSGDTSDVSDCENTEDKVKNNKREDAIPEDDADYYY
jgi:hypothetical protein